ncbi:hypothetical protein VKT23_012912 [Stygiomarasmius scandens]|uniref:Mid2 domain-containing protein n=1 Tax=Marasmiellus scandens TaxID=2682957 RepID=A0ABR1J7C5_9AGAR
MSSRPTAWRVADDSDGRFSYSQQTNSSSSTENGLDAQNPEGGVAYNNTVHVTDESTSSATIFGSMFSAASSPEDVMTLDCILDGHIVSSTIFTSVDLLVANSELCQIGNTNRTDPSPDPGEHEISVNMTALVPVQLFVDYIIYEPSPNDPVDGDVLQIIANQVPEFSPIQFGSELSLSWSSGWEANDTSPAITTTPGSNVTVTFNGTALQLYGELSGTLPNNATYQLDGQTVGAIDLIPLSIAEEVPFTHQLLLNISSLSPAEHMLVMAHNGSPTGMPLTIESFLLTSLTTQQQAALSPPSPQSPSTPSSTSPPIPSGHTSRHHLSTGGIIGVVLGSLVLVGLCALLLWLRSRRHWKNRDREVSELEPTPFVATSGSTLPRKASRSHPGVIDNSTPRRHNQVINMLQLRNLKLQQRLWVIRGRRISQSEQSETGHVRDREVEQQTPSLQRELSDSGEMDEIPPDYTEL